MILLRHCEADYAKEKMLNEFPGVPLTLAGKEHAKEIAKTVPTQSFTKIIASDMLRTTQTAQILAQELKLKIEYDSRIREVIDSETNFTKIAAFFNEYKHQSVLVVTHFNSIRHLTKKSIQYGEYVVI